MTGIELLQMIKDNKLEDGTLVRTTEAVPHYYLFRKNGEHPNFGKCDSKGNAGGLQGQYKFMTTRALFRDYEIVEVLREVPNKIEKIEFVDEFSDSYYDTCLIKAKDKVNDLIDAVNYLLDRQNKG